ncbi:MAG: MBG domain-containing protein, partial [Verrucomicrobiota bacterium]
MKAARVIFGGILILFLAVVIYPARAQPPSGHLSDDQITGAPLNGNDRSVVVLIHGWTNEDPPNAPGNSFAGGDWPQLVNALRARLNGSGWKLLLFHWEEDASTGRAIDFSDPIQGNLFGLPGFANARNAAANAFLNGAPLADSLHQSAPDLRKVVFVAHSAGSWVAYRAVDQLLQKNPYVIMNLVLLDPFIPGVDPSVPTLLNTSTMSQLVAHPSVDRIFRLENYYAVDFTDRDFDWGSGGGSKATSQPFIWRSRDINHRVDYDSRVYLGHGGPIRFYADTVTATTTGATVPDGLAQAPWDFTSVGFYRGLVIEGFLLPSITAEPRDATATSGGTASFSVSASRADSFQWFKNGPSYPATGSTLTFNTVSASDAGEYVVRVSNANGQVFSEKAVLQVSPAPAPSRTLTVQSSNPNSGVLILVSPNDKNGNADGSTPFPRTYDNNTQVTLVAPATVGENQFQKWLKDGVDAGINRTTVLSMDANHEMAAVYATSPTYTLTVTASSPDAAEQGNTSGRFTITRTGSTQDALAVSYTTSGTAINGTDYLTPNGAATIPAGEISVNITVTPLDDTVPESEETVILTLSSSSAYFLGTPSSATVTIADNDTPVVGTDTRAPMIEFITPNGSLSYVNGSTMFINGNAFDDIGVIRVTWTNDRGGKNGEAGLFIPQPGQVVWHVVAVPLQENANVITVTAFDAAGKSSSATLTVYATIPTSGLIAPIITASDGTFTDKVYVEWQSQNQSRFEVWRSVNNDLNSAEKVGEMSVGFYRHEFAVPGTTYWYWVRGAMEPPNWSEFSTPDSGWRKVPPLSHLTISGPSFVLKRTSAQFTATANFADATSQTAQAVSANWSVDSPLATITGDGLLTAAEVNSDTTVAVSARYIADGITRTASLLVLLRASSARVLEVPTEYPTIQAAIAAAQSGDTVFVLPGEYLESVTLKEGIVLQGSGPDRTKIKVISSDGVMVRMAANCTLEGFTIDHVNRFIGAIHCLFPATISNNIIFGEVSIAQSTGKCFVRNNVIVCLSASAISLNNNCSSCSPLLVDIENNTITGVSPEGLFLQGSQGSVINVKNNIIANKETAIYDEQVNRAVQHLFLSYNLFWNNAANVSGNPPPVQGLGTGDIASADPMFVDTANHDYRLRAGSPVINTGDPDPKYNDLDGTRNDRGAYGGPGYRIFPKANQRITFSAMESKTYGDAAFDVIVAASSGLPVNLEIISGPATVSGRTISLTGAGAVLLRASQAGNGDWNVAPEVVQSLTVNKRMLTVAAGDASRSYGGTNPAFAATISGFVNGETREVVQGTPDLSSPALPSSPIGSYPIIASWGTLSAANYDFTFSNGTLLVTKAELVVRSLDRKRTYGTANPELVFEMAGLLNGDVPSVVTGAPELSCTATPGSPVGSYPINVTGGSLSATNYAFTVRNGVLEVRKAPLVVTAENANRAYKAADPAFTARIAGFVNNETDAVLHGQPTFTPTASADSPVGSYLIKPSLGSLNAENYVFLFADGVLTVIPAVGQVSLGNLTQTFDGRIKAVSATTVPAGLSVNLTYGGSANPPVNIGSYLVEATVNDPNYTGSASGTLVINKATLVLTWANPADITYGTALTGTQLNATASVAGSFNYSPAAGTVLNAGSNQQLTVTFTPADTANYTSTTKTVTLNVAKAAPVVTWSNPADITYGTALSGTQLNATANVPGSFSYSPAAGTVLNAGNDQQLTVTFTPDDTANYITATKTVTLNVAKVAPVLTWANPADITYGTALSGAQLNATANVAGSLSYSPGAGTVLSAGNNRQLTVTFTPDDTANYTSMTMTVTLNVAKAAPVLTWSNPADITYGTALSGTQLNATASVAGSFSYSPAAATVLNAGNNQQLTITFTPADTANYGSTTKTVTLNVAKAAPVLTWSNPADITYGTALSGTQLNATASLAGSFSYSPAAGTALNAGSNQQLTVIFTPDDTANYITATKTVTLNVAKAAPVLTWSNPADIIDGTPLGSGQLNATANVAGSFTYSPPAGTVLNVGTNQSLTLTFAPTDTANYLNATKTVTINVLKATPVVTRIIRLEGDLAFGNVPVGTSAQRTLTIANTGNSTLTVSGISYPGGFRSGFSG